MPTLVFIDKICEDLECAYLTVLSETLKGTGNVSTDNGVVNLIFLDARLL